MKKLLCLLMLSVILINMIPFYAFASSSPQTNDEVIYLDDGSYIVVELSEGNSLARTTVQKNKSYTYYSSSDEALWKAVLTGTFTYNGSTATCTSSSCDVTIYDDAWYVVSNSASKSGASATAEVTMGKKFLGITIDKESISISLTCSPTGSFS